MILAVALERVDTLVKLGYELRKLFESGFLLTDCRLPVFVGHRFHDNDFLLRKRVKRGSLLSLLRNLRQAVDQLREVRIEIMRTFGGTREIGGIALFHLFLGQRLEQGHTVSE